MRFLVNREDLGKRTIGYIFYDADSKGFVGMTEKQVKDALGKGERLYGLVLDADGEIAMDCEGFCTANYMVRSGINTLSPAVETEFPANLMYVVVGVCTNESGMIYETVSSRYARTEMSESKVKMLLEFGCIQGGVYLEDGELKVCDGVVVSDAAVENSMPE